jgi:EmrB/QacA subfamily drug resistance transporter
MSTTSPTPSAPEQAPAVARPRDTGSGAVAPTERYRWRWIVLAVVLSAEIMDLLDTTIVTVAGPSVRNDLGGGASTLQWLSAAYTLSFAVLLVTGARLGDIFGRRRLFLLGSAGFTAMSAACALAPSPELLIACRALQGAFGALLIPQGFGLLKEVFAEDEMATVFGSFGPVMGLSAIAGPIVAGLLIDANLLGTGWRLVFLINVPVGVAALATAARTLPRGAMSPGARLDLGGMALVGLASLAIIYPLIQGREQGWPVWIFAMLAGGLALSAAFVVYERHRRESPLIDPALLSNHAYTNGILVALSFFATFAGLMLIVSLFCQLGEGFSPVHAGLTLVPITVGMVLSLGASFALVGRFGRWLLHLGVILAAAGCAALGVTVSGAGSATTLALAPSLFVIGVGAGFIFGQLFDIILAGVAMEQVGSASGVLNAVQQLASSIGIAVLGTIFFSELTGGGPATSALGTIAWLCLIPLAVTFALAFRLPYRARAQPAG